MPLPPSKDLLPEAEAAASRAGNLLLRVLKMLDTQDKHTKLLELQAAQIEALRDQVRVLEAREEMLLAKMEASAARANAEVYRRIGFLEGRASRD